MIEIAKLAEENLQVLKDALLSTPVKRLDEVKAARKPRLRWER